MGKCIQFLIFGFLIFLSAGLQNACCQTGRGLVEINHCRVSNITKNRLANSGGCNEFRLVLEGLDQKYSLFLYSIAFPENYLIIGMNNGCICLGDSISLTLLAMDSTDFQKYPEFQDGAHPINAVLRTVKGIEGGFSVRKKRLFGRRETGIFDQNHLFAVFEGDLFLIEVLPPIEHFREHANRICPCR